MVEGRKEGGKEGSKAGRRGDGGSTRIIVERTNGQLAVVAGGVALLL